MTDNSVHEDLCCDELKTYSIVKFVWKLRNFSKKTRVLKSRLFPTSAPQGLGQWSLELNPHYRNIVIILKQKFSEVSSAKVVFCLMDGEGAIAKREATEYTEEGCQLILAQRTFITNSGNNLLPNDVLTIVCEVEIQVSTVEDPYPSTCGHPPCPLAEDLGQLLATMSLSDITIAVRGAELKAHKNILAARSAVFAAMFSNPMLEKETSVVEITDMDADVFQAMLEFMYTGKDVTQMCWTHDLLAAATKYQLERLKGMCEETLCKALSLDNVLENLALADLYSAAKLKALCISLVTEHGAQILRSPSWDSFKRDHQYLLAEILEKIYLQ